MIKQTVEYEDFSGNLVKEDVYLHLNKAELFKIYAENPELSKITDTKNIKEMVDTLEMIITRAYGIRSDDGTKFTKRDKNGRMLYLDFIDSPLYSELLLQILNDADNLNNIIKGLLPKSLGSELDKYMDEYKKTHNINETVANISLEAKNDNHDDAKISSMQPEIDHYNRLELKEG